MGAVAITLAVLLLVLARIAMALEKACFYVPLRELERRAERGDHISAALMRVAAYGGEVRLLLASLAVLLSASGLVWLPRLVPWFVSGPVAAIFIGGMFFWLPRTRLHAMEARLAAWCAPNLAWVLMKLHPALRPIVSSGGKIFKGRTHTGIFELADLAELFEHQARQRDNRISAADLARVQSVLGADNHEVRDQMTPAKRVLVVNAADEISPVLVNELHRSGQAHFPVYEHHRADIIGTLAMERIADVRLRGNVGGNIDRHVAYIHENDSLEQAIRAFYETNQQLLIVINSSGKHVGVISLSDILRRLLGGLDNEAFGRYDDRDAVAGRHPSKKSPSKKAETVVE